MVTRDDVFFAYRFILGREPENEDVVQAAMKGCSDRDALRRGMLCSPEFAAKSGSLFAAEPSPHYLYGGDCSIEVECDRRLLAQLLSKIEQTWTRLGQEDPYYSVLTHEKYKIGNFAQHEESYWRSGEQEVSRFQNWLRRNGLAIPAGAICLEYGCGTGRVTRWLSKAFREVIACDISPAHLKLAREAADAEGPTNISLVHIASLATLDSLPVFDALFSAMVLQHNPPPVIAYILDRLLARLRPGGVAYFQVPTLRPGYHFATAEYLDPDSENGKHMEMHVIPQYNVFQIAARNNCEPVEVSPDGYTSSLQYVSSTFLLRKREGANVTG